MSFVLSPTQTVTIFGGSGFIGSHLTARMKELGLYPKIGDLRRSDQFPGDWTVCDVRKADTLKALCNGSSAIINLAAEHRDDVRPISRYHETNVEGARQVCQAARESDIRTLIFTSSAAVYGFHPTPVDESGPFEPFNAYGTTKLLAESVYRAWADEDTSRSLVIIRPTVVFGEGNRGNVYNLLRQIATGKFLMVGSGTNRKSMAYVGNVADALLHSLTLGPGTHIFNYADSPDLTMKQLVSFVNKCLGRPEPNRWSIPFPLALTGGHLLDVISLVTRRSLPISAVRVRKFCENTQFDANRIRGTGFSPRLSLEEALQQTILEEFHPSRIQ